MKNALLIIPCKTGYALVEIDDAGSLPAFAPERVQCFAALDHYSRSETVLEAVKEHFKDAPDA